MTGINGSDLGHVRGLLYSGAAALGRSCLPSLFLEARMTELNNLIRQKQLYTIWTKQILWFLQVTGMLKKNTLISWFNTRSSFLCQQYTSKKLQRHKLRQITSNQVLWVGVWGSGVQSKPWLYCKFEVACMKPCLKAKQGKSNNVWLAKIYLHTDS